MNRKQKKRRAVRAKRQAKIRKLNEAGVIFPDWGVMTEAIVPSERGSGHVDDAGYLNIRDGAIVFALDAGINIDTHPRGNDDIDYRAGRKAIDAEPKNWIKIPKMPMNYSGGTIAFVDRFVSEVAEKHGLIIRFI